MCRQCPPPTIEVSSADGICIGIAKSRLAQVLFGQLNPLDIVLLLNQHGTVLEELVDGHLRLLESRGTFLGVHQLLPDGLNSDTGDPLSHLVIVNSSSQSTKEVCSRMQKKKKNNYWNLLVLDIPTELNESKPFDRSRILM